MNCKSCSKYRGDCGHHFIDTVGHIDYEIPSESAMDRYGDCEFFKTTDEISNGRYIYIRNVKIYNTDRECDIPKYITLGRFQTWEHQCNDDGTYTLLLKNGTVLSEEGIKSEII